MSCGMDGMERTKHAHRPLQFERSGAFRARENGDRIELWRSELAVVNERAHAL